MTALFPKKDVPITICQGQTGDCYFLASLDCIFKADTGLDRVKSLFTETKEGVTVRIKRSTISTYLKTDKLMGKYGYFYDPVTDEDVFLLSKARLEEIDATSIGVTTNSLAVKILEHLSAYFYVGDWDSQAVLASVIAHNDSNRHQGTSTEFMGFLLGVDTEDLSDINQIIELKTIDPKYPIYISINYEVKDSYGTVHGRHGLRLDQIIPNPLKAGEYEFILVNPWDNQKKESYSLAEIRSKNARFCLFNLPTPALQQAKRLLSLSVDERKEILSTPGLLKLIRRLQALDSCFDLEGIEYCSTLYQCVPELDLLFEELILDEKKTFLQALNASKGDRDLFIKSLIANSPRLEFVDLLYQNGLINEETLGIFTKSYDEAHEVITNLLHKANHIVVSFNGFDTIELINQHLSQQLAYLNQLKQDPQLRDARRILGLEVSETLITAIEEKSRSLIQASEQQINAVYQQNLADCLAHIHAFSINFSRQNSLQQIESQEQQLIEDLKQLVASNEIQEALKVPQFGSLAEKIECSLSAKEVDIVQASKKQKEELQIQKAKGVIDAYQERIQGFKIVLSDDESKVSLSEQRSQLLCDLRAIGNERQLRQALALVPQEQASIQKSLLAQESWIVYAVDDFLEQCKKQKIQNTLQKSLELIRSFPLLFSGLNSIELIQKHQNCCLSQLDFLIDKPEVQDALIQS